MALAPSLLSPPTSTKVSEAIFKSPPGSFADYRDRNNEALAKLGYTPEKQLSEYDLPARRGRRSPGERILDLLQQRAELEQLASTQQQREAYGIERWHRDFVRLATLLPPTDYPYSKQRFLAEVWKTVRNSSFGRFQQAFSDPEHWVVLPFEVDRGRIYLTPENRQKLQTLSVQGCLVVADRVPDQLAEGLKLVDLSPYKRKPLQRLAAKCSLAVSDGIKMHWDEARLLDFNNPRVKIVSTPSAEARNRYRAAPEVPNDLVGTILYYREQTAGIRRPAFRAAGGWLLEASHFRSTYGAARKNDHQQDSYDEERAKLAATKVDLQALNKRINKDWTRSASRPLKDELKKLAQEKLLKAAELLKHCVNEFKVEAREFAAKSATFTDKTEKENVTVALSRMVPVITRLESRLSEIPQKASFSTKDRARLCEQIAAHEKILHEFRLDVKKASRLVAESALFGPAEMSQAEVNRLADELLVLTDLRAARLKGLNLMPFKVIGEGWAAECHNFEISLRTRDRDATEETLVCMHVVGKFSEVVVRFEEIKGYVAVGARVPLQKIRSLVKELEKLFEERDVFPQHLVPQLVPFFDEMSTTIQAIGRGLDYYVERNLSLDERIQMDRRLKKYLDRLDPTKSVKSMARWRPAQPR